MSFFDNKEVHKTVLELLVYHQDVRQLDTVKVLEPTVKVMCYNDRMWGGTLGLM